MYIKKKIHISENIKYTNLKKSFYVQQITKGYVSGEV